MNAVKLVGVLLVIVLLLPYVEARGQLTNPDFETIETINSGGIPSVLNDWEGNVSAVVGAENGVAPFSGNRMLRFLFAHDGQAGGGVGVGVRQLMEIQPGLTATASAFFNRVPGDAQTDTEFHFELEAYGGDLLNLNRLASDTFTLFSDGNLQTWEPATASLTMPPGTRYLSVHLLALENIFNNTSGDEFDGHYADGINAVRSAGASERSAASGRHCSCAASLLGTMASLLSLAIELRFFAGLRSAGLVRPSTDVSTLLSRTQPRRCYCDILASRHIPSATIAGMYEKPQRARTAAEITGAAQKCAELCRGKPNSAAMELFASGLMAVGWSQDDATAVKREAIQKLAGGRPTNC